MEYDGWWTKGKIIFFSILAFVIIVGGSIGGPILNDALNASTAPLTSSLQEKSQVYTAQNRINQYKQFFAEDETYLSDLAAVKTNVQTLNAFNKQYTSTQITNDPTGNLIQVQQEDISAATGAKQICVSAAEAYNKDSKEIVTGAQFKGHNIPKSVSVTACQTGSITNK